MTTWHVSGATDGGVTVNIGAVDIGDVDVDTDLIEVTAAVSGVATAQLFVRLVAVQAAP